jgi:alpha-1,2-mannosyltransferase
MSGIPPQTAAAAASGASVTGADAGRAGDGRRLLALGAAAFAVSVAVYVAGWAAGWTALTPNATDLQVYVDGGLIIRHVVPPYDGHLASPLYDWQSLIGLDFTYTPFAAVIFAAVSFLPFGALAPLSAVVNVAALAGSLWLVLGPLGYRSRVRVGTALLAAGVTLWLEPVQRTLFFGQVNLVLMLLVLADLCLPNTAGGRRLGTWWKGAGIGIAAGIKLVPLVFIPYLLLTRRFRQAAVAAGMFCATVAIGFAVTPRDSDAWWLHGLFYQGDRVGFPAVMQNQSLHGLITRLAGSVAGGQAAWLAVAVVVAIAGIGAAAVLDRAGHPAPGILACALTGLLISPISWDHHWVWIAPGLAVMGHYAVRGWQAGRHRAAAALGALTAVVWAVFGARPEGVWLPGTAGVELTGLLWAVPTTRETTFFQLGDQPWFPEYHYHGLQLIGGNLFVLAGLGLLALLIAVAVKTITDTTSPNTGRFPWTDSIAAGGSPRWLSRRSSPR